MASLLDLVKIKKSSKLEELKIKNGETVQLRLFTDQYEKAKLHYGSTELLRGHFHCLGIENKCPACLAGQKASYFYLMPVYVISKEVIAVLKISENDSQNSLLPQITHALSKDTASTFQTVSRVDNFNFKVNSIASTNHRLLGAETIANFVQLVKDGATDLKTIYRTPTVDELLDIPEIRIALELKKEIEDSGA